MIDAKELSQLKLMIIGLVLGLLVSGAGTAIWFYFDSKSTITQLKKDVQEIKDQLKESQRNYLIVIGMLEAVNGIKVEQESMKKTFNDRMDKYENKFDRFTESYYNRVPRP